jgi:hypothetical protein|nr:hypothetical protein [Neorhizobium tomejilense]
MSRISKVPRETAVKVFGSIWLADDLAGRICEHLGNRKPSLHFGDAYVSLDEAKAAKPAYEVQHLPDHIVLPNVTPVPKRRPDGSESAIPREVFIVEFGNLLSEGLRIVPYQIESVEFEIAPPHLLGKVDFVAKAFIAGQGDRYRVLVEYDSDFGLNIVENPRERNGNTYIATGQSMAFFREAEAVAEANRFAENLVAAADWRSRSLIGKRKSEGGVKDGVLPTAAE